MPSRRIDRGVVAKLFCDLQPPSIRQRIYSDDVFLAGMRLRSGGIFSLEGRVRIERASLFDAVRQVLNTRDALQIADLDGRLLQIGLEADAVVLSGSGEESERWHTPVAELVLLSPHQSERTGAVGGVLKMLGPTVPDFDAIREAAAQRELSDAEVGALLTEKINGVIASQANVEQALHDREVTMDALVPRRLSYYEQFAGPSPGELAPDSYIRDLLSCYRGELLRRDLARGIQICLLGALRGDLSPGPWTTDLSGDELWEALKDTAVEENPFVLLGALDVATRRLEDVRYAGLADVLVRKLLGETLQRSDGVDTYELLPVLAQLSFETINTQEGSVIRAPFWRRMSAWMHAGALIRVLREYRLDWPRFQDWVSHQLTPVGQCVAILDLRREPMYRATQMSPKALRSEVLGRLIDLKTQCGVQGVVMPKAELIEDLGARGGLRSFLDRTGPGPLEGHVRPAHQGSRRLREEDAKTLISELGQDRDMTLLSVLADLSQTHDLGEDVLAHARAVTKATSLTGPPEKRDALLVRLADGCLAACAQRDVELAQSIGRVVVSGAATVDCAERAIALFRALLFASVAFEDDDTWGAWIEEQLTAVAYVLPRGEATRAFLSQLEALKSVAPARCCIHGRAEAVALSAS